MEEMRKVDTWKFGDRETPERRKGQDRRTMPERRTRPSLGRNARRCTFQPPLKFQENLSSLDG